MTSTVLPPLRAFFTTTCLSMRSLSAATWEMMPTRRSPSVRPARTRMACSRLSSSSEPKPSSRKRVSDAARRALDLVREAQRQRQ